METCWKTSLLLMIVNSPSHLYSAQFNRASLTAAAREVATGIPAWCGSLDLVWTKPQRDFEAKIRAQFVAMEVWRGTSSLRCCSVAAARLRVACATRRRCLEESTPPSRLRLQMVNGAGAS